MSLFKSNGPFKAEWGGQSFQVYDAKISSKTMLASTFQGTVVSCSHLVPDVISLDLICTMEGNGLLVMQNLIDDGWKLDLIKGVFYRPEGSGSL
jgi:hypothetical protein